MANSGIGTIDYIVFVGSLILSSLIGLFYTFVQKQRTTDQILVGNRDLSMFPVCCSILASSTSAVLILGMTSEIYTRGTLIAEVVFSIPICVPLAGLLFLPTLYPLKLTSVYEYFGLRYQSKAIKLIATTAFIIGQTVSTGVVIYAPALALQTVVNIPTSSLVLIMGGCAGLYTSFGGIKAVVWTDTFQSFITFAGLVAIIVQGSKNVGGLSNAFSIANENRRIEFGNFTVDPFLRHSTINIFIGHGIIWLHGFGMNQTTVQRYGSMRTFKRAFLTLIISGSMIGVTMGVAAIAGIVIYANYAGCDPLTLGHIKKEDEISPYFVLEHLSSIPGLVGLFVAALVCAALSTVSSILNSLAAVVWQDFLRQNSKFAALSPSSKGHVVKIISLVFTLIITGIGLIAGELGGILSTSLTISGSINGPLFALFVMGMFFPIVNKWGAGIGIIAGLIVTATVGLGAKFYEVSVVNLPFRTDECQDFELNEYFNMTIMTSVTLTTVNDSIPKYFAFSYMLYPLIGFLVTFVVGIIVSLLTGPSKIDESNQKYFHPYLRKSQVKQSLTSVPKEMYGVINNGV